MDNPYQNPDLEVRNPFADSVVPEPQSPNTPTAAKPNNKNFSIPKDPKIKILIILVVIIAVLSVLSFIITIFRKSQLKPVIVEPTPIIETTPVPTETPALTMPAEINAKFEKIDQNTRTNIQFDPPQIDPDIGL
jgi:flagellar basal body-associated protein FliL